MVRVNQNGMLSIVIVAFAVNLTAQTLPSSYYGQLSFDYAGTMNGRRGMGVAVPYYGFFLGRTPLVSCGVLHAFGVKITQWLRDGFH